MLPLAGLAIVSPLTRPSMELQFHNVAPAPKPKLMSHHRAARSGRPKAGREQRASTSTP